MQSTLASPRPSTAAVSRFGFGRRRLRSLVVVLGATLIAALLSAGPHLAAASAEPTGPGLSPASGPAVNISWTNATGAVQPSPRAGAGMAFDPTLGGELLFGGCTSGHYWNYTCTATGDTWEFVGGNWTQLAPVHSPSARLYPAMTYDAADGYLLLFGGSSGWPGPRTPLNDTWEFNGTDWIQLHPVASPPGAYAAGIAYDAAAGEAVLFGGELTTDPDFGVASNSTWTFAAGNWSLVPSPAGMTARYGETVWYDAQAGTVEMFGGVTNVPTWSDFNDQWSFANGHWSPTGANASYPVGGARNGAVAVFDPRLNASVLVDGHYAGTYYNETWLIRDGGGTQAWVSGSPVVAPPFRWGATIAFDPKRCASVLVGGYTYGNYSRYPAGGGTDYYFGDTWELSVISGGSQFGCSTSGMGISNGGNPHRAGPLQVGITLSQTSGSAPLAVRFVASSTGGTPPFSYVWSFGDASPDVAGASVVHTYVALGSFHPTLLVTDAQGHSVRSALASIQVGAAPTTSGSFSIGFLTPWQLVALVVAIDGAIALAVALARYRNQRLRKEGEELVRAMVDTSPNEEGSGPDVR